MYPQADEEATRDNSPAAEVFACRTNMNAVVAPKASMYNCCVKKHLYAASHVALGDALFRVRVNLNVWERHTAVRADSVGHTTKTLQSIMRGPTSRLGSGVRKSNMRLQE